MAFDLKIMEMEKALQKWHEIVKTPNPAKLEALLSDDVVFYSPVVHTPQMGKQITSIYLTAAAMLLKDLEYHKEITSNHHAALEFTANIGETIINGIDLITFDNEGKITEFKVMIRPLQAVNKIHEKMQEMLKKL